MDIIPLKDIQKRAKALGVGIKALCKMADIKEQSFYYKRNHPSSVNVIEYKRLIEILDELAKNG